MSTVLDIASEALQNDFFRKVIYTGKHSQVVLMALKPGEEIGLETHNDNDQILVFVKGNGKVILDNQESSFREGSLVFVSAGTEHNLINTGSESAKLYTIYAPSHHPDGTIHRTKKEAEY